MNLLYRALTALSLLFLLPILQACAVAATTDPKTGSLTLTPDVRSAGTIVDDQAIEIKAIHAIHRNTALSKQSHITIISYNNSILLVGQTSSEALKREAADAINQIPKVRHVYNELSIGKPINWATRSHDSWITTQIKTKLIGNKTVSTTRIKVVTENGIVYLLGIATPEEEQAATEIARDIKGVDKVVQIFEAPT